MQKFTNVLRLGILYLFWDTNLYHQVLNNAQNQLEFKQFSSLSEARLARKHSAIIFSMTESLRDWPSLLPLITFQDWKHANNPLPAGSSSQVVCENTVCIWEANTSGAVQEDLGNPCRVMGAAVLVSVFRAVLIYRSSASKSRKLKIRPVVVARRLWWPRSVGWWQDLAPARMPGSTQEPGHRRRLWRGPVKAADSSKWYGLAYGWVLSLRQPLLRVWSILHLIRDNQTIRTTTVY